MQSQIISKIVINPKNIQNFLTITKSINLLLKNSKISNLLRIMCSIKQIHFIKSVVWVQMEEDRMEVSLEDIEKNKGVKIFKKEKTLNFFYKNKKTYVRVY